MMQRVLFVIGSMVGNGAERVMSLLVNYGATKDLEVALVLIKSDVISFPLNERVKVFTLGENLSQNRAKASYERIMRLRKNIKEFNPDVVVSFLTTCNIYSCIAGLGTGIPVIISERNDPIRDCPGKARRLMRNLAYRLASGYIFQTDEALKCYAKAVRKSATVIPNPVKDDLPFADIQNRKKVIVAAGRLTKQKNYPMMLKAFSLFVQMHHEYMLHIYGEGEELSSLEAYAKQLGVDDAVEFMGYKSDLHERIASAAMFVMSSDYEGISNSLLECLSMGIPCISTDCPCGGARYLIQDGENGLLVPVGDSEAMAQAMKRVAESSALAGQFYQKCRQVREAHSEKVILEKYYDFFEKSLQDKKADRYSV